MAKAAPPWHGEARRMRADGATIGEIAAAFAVRTTAVALMLDENGERARDRAYHAAFRKTYEARKRLGLVAETVRRDAIAAHTPRRPRAILAPADERLAAARAFAAGQIGRAELMRRVCAGDAGRDARATGDGRCAEISATR